MAIAVYRQQHSQSPTIEFGRMPASYRMSSANNARLVAAGKRFRRGATSETVDSHIPGIPPAGPLTGDPTSSPWAGHARSLWAPILETSRHLSVTQLGLYRIRRATEFLYIGEGRVAGRLAAHIHKSGNLAERQATVFADPVHLEASWVLNQDWLKHHRLELENDLIAAHILATGAIPAAQFLG